MSRQDEQQISVRNLLQGRIFRGELPAGSRIDETLLRRETGATVRAVRGALRELTANGILKRKQRQGTFVALRLPPGMVTPLPALNSVAIISSLNQGMISESAYARDILVGVTSRLATPATVNIIANHSVRSCSIDEAPPFDSQNLQQTAQGVIGLELNNGPVLNDLVRDGLPVVAIDFWQPRSQFDVVAIDHEEAGYLATGHLLALGHRVIGFIGEAPNSKSNDPTWQARLNGYLRAMVASGEPNFPQWILGMQRDGTLIPPRLPDFHRKFQPTAYVLCSGGGLPTTLAVLNDLKLRCPEDISLACADNAVPHLGRPSTSHIQVDLGEVGRMAVRVLAARVACRAMPPFRVTIPVSFLPGCTSGRVRV